MAQNTGNGGMKNGDTAYLHRLLANVRRTFACFELTRAAVWLALGGMALGFTEVWLDMYVHLAAGWRWAVLALLTAGAVTALARLAFAVLLFPAGERWLSVHIERKYPALKNRLVTAIQILRGGPETADFDPEFCERLLHDTCERVRLLDLRPIVPWRSLKAPLAVALLCLLFGTVMRQQWPDGFDVAVTRLIFPGRNIAVPARTKIALTPAGITLPRGDSLRLRALITGRETPSVSLHVRRTDRDWTIISMLPESGLVSNPAPNGFTYEIRDINDPLEYFVSAGDGRTERYRISLVDRPRLRSIALGYRYPEYLGMEPRDVEKGICTVEAPVGTRVQLTVETDSPVQGGHIRLVLQAEAAPRRIPLRPETPQRLSASFTLEKSGAYSAIVTNSAGLGEKQPAEYPLIAQLDTPPVVEVLEPGRDLVLDDPQSVPVLATARDDFGLSALYSQITVSNTLSVTTNGSGALVPPGRKIADIPEPCVKSQNASLQVPCDKVDGFEKTGRLTYTVYAVDRKGQVSASRSYSIMLTQAAKDRAKLESATNKPPEAAQEQANKPQLPPELAQIQALIEKQKSIAEKVRESRQEADRFRPDAPVLAREIRTAFDQEKRFATDITGTRGWAQGKLDEMAKNPNRQNPQFERALRNARDLMDSLHSDEVRDATEALRNAFMAVAPAGTNSVAAAAGATQAPQPAGATPPPGAPAQAAPAAPAGAPQAPPPGGPTPPPAPQSPLLPAPPLSSEGKKQVRQQLEESLKQQEQVVQKLEALMQRMEASLPGQVDQATLDALDQQIREELAQDAEQFREGLKLASEEALRAAEQFKPLAERQSSLRDKTVDTEAEKVKNLAKSEDKIKLDTGHAEERVKADLPWLEPPKAVPAAISNNLMTASTAPRVPVPQTPQAPRKEVMQGPIPPMPQVYQQPGEHPMPKLLVPDRFPTTFRGDLSDKPIPAPPPNAVPTGRAPTTSLRKMTEEEKTKLRDGVMLDSLELLDDGMAMGLGAPENEEMPEEMLLEPGAQFSSGPSAPDSKPGMELGQSAGPVLGNPLQPPAGGNSQSPQSPQNGSMPPPPGQQSSSQNQSQSQSQSTGTPGGSGGGGGSGPQKGRPAQPGDIPNSPAMAAMQEASDAMVAGNRSGALENQDMALAGLLARQAQLDRVRTQTDELSRQFDDIQRIVGADDIQQAEALNALEQGLRNPAWNVLQEPLTPAAEIQLRAMQERLRDSYEELGGSAAILPAGDSSMTNVVDWARFTLPPHLRQELLDGLRESGPPAYQKILEEYYKAISKEK